MPWVQVPARRSSSVAPVAGEASRRQPALPLTVVVAEVATAAVHRVQMEADKLMQIYFSIGVMAPRVIPEAYRVEAG